MQEGPGRGGPELAELVDRTRGLQPWRRVFHALSGVTLASLPAVPGVERTEVLWLLGAGSVVLLVLDLARLRTPALNAFAFRLLRPLISPREEEAVASSTWYAVGAFLTSLLLPVAVAVPAILVLALADPAAAIVGRTWGRRPVGTGTVVGSTTFFVVASAVLVVASGVGAGAWVAGLAAAAVATAAEVAPTRLDDNLVVPLAAGGALHLILSLG